MLEVMSKEWIIAISKTNCLSYLKSKFLLIVAGVPNGHLLFFPEESEPLGA